MRSESWRLVVFWLYHSTSKPGNANPAGPSKDSVCVRRRAQTQISEVTGTKAGDCTTNICFAAGKIRVSFLLEICIFFNICIIPTLKTNPNISHLQCHSGFCSEAIFEEDFYMCVFLKYGIQARLGPSQHNITQYS